MTETITNVVARILPIILIIGLGNLIRSRRLLSEQATDELRGLVVNIALPAVLFIAFLEMELTASYLGLFAVIAAVCILMLLLGYLLRRALSITHEYYPFLITGFEFGMVGITLFGTAYGMTNVGFIAIVDLSHELFIWFVLATLLAARRDGVNSAGKTLRGFVTSPLIIAIVLALTLNLTGLVDSFRQVALGQAIVQTLDFLGGLLIPLILILIGYGMRLSWNAVRETIGVVILRLAILIPMGLAINLFVVRRWLGLDPAFESAIFTFFILPPPYIIPLFIKQEDRDERTYVNNVLSVYTAISLFIFVIYFAFNPMLR